MLTEGLILLIVSADLVFSIYAFYKIKKIEEYQNQNYYCRYPDTDVKEMIVDHELEKVKKLETAIKELTDETNKRKYDDK